MAAIDSIRTILNENLGIEPETITEETTFESLDIDSLDMTEIMCEIEDAFNIDFGEPEGLETVGQMVAHIEGLL